MWNLKNKTNKQNKTETDIDMESKLVVPRREWGEMLGKIDEED